MAQRYRSAYVNAHDDEGGPIRVMIVDDHVVVRRGMIGFLELLDDVEIVGQASDGNQAIAVAKEVKPDVILMDIVMPNLDGIGATAEIKKALPATEIVAVTSFLEDEKVFAALQAGAIGYLLKDSEADAVAAAIRSAHRGEVHLHPAVAARLARQLVIPKRSEPEIEPLTEREKEVLRLVAEGLSNQEIANRLVISNRTARTHVSNILAKLGLPSRTQAALYAIKTGLVPDPHP